LYVTGGQRVNCIDTWLPHTLINELTQTQSQQTCRVFDNQLSGQSDAMLEDQPAKNQTSI